MAQYRQGADGTYQRGHQAKLSSFGGGLGSFLPPLSIPDTLILHSRFARQGLSDALKLESVIETLATNKLVQQNTLKSSILQGVVLVSAITIKPLLSRTLPHSATSISVILFNILWLYPLSIAAIYYAGLLRASQEALDRRGASRGDYRGITASLVTESYKVLVLANYLLFASVLRFIPYIGPILGFLYACIVDSYYLYEAQWLKQSWPLSERVSHLENRWSYFVGFGFPITVISYWSSDPIINLALFSLFYPLFAIMTPSSIPQPLDPNLPTSSMSLSVLPQAQGSFSMAAAEGGEEARGRRGNPMVPIRIHVLILADKIYAVLVKTFVPRKKDARGGGGGGGGAYPGGHGHAGGPGYGQFDPNAGSMYNDGSGSGMGGGAGGAGAAMRAPAAYPGYGHAGQTPPRRGHVQTESSVGVGAPPAASHGGEFADPKLDSLISAAARRRKGD